MDNSPAAPAAAGDPSKAVLAIGGTTYSVIDGPTQASALVKEARTEVMQNLNLDRVVTDLDRTNELLYVAACSVAGFGAKAGLSAKIASLQYRLLTSCSDAVTAMSSFRDAAGGVLDLLKRAMRELYNLREDRTVRILAGCEQYGLEMAKIAGGLADGFKALADDAEHALESTLTERDTQEEDRRAGVKKQAEIRALDEKAKALKASLAVQMEKMQKLYDEAKEAQNRAEDRAFGLAITSTITSALSSGVAAFAAVKTAPMTAGANLANSIADTLKSNKPTDTAKSAVTGTAPATEKAPEKPAAGATPKAGDKKEEKKDDKTTATAAGAGGTTASAAKGESNTAASVAAGVAAAAAKTAESGQQMSGSYDAIAARYAEEKGKYLDMLMDLQKQEREALGNIALYAEQMKIAVNDTALAKSAVASLQQAVAALKQVVTILETAKLFWTMMATACKRLGSDQLRKTIDLYREDPPADRLAEWSRDDFKATMLQLTARWCALGVIATDFQTAVTASRERVKGTINEAPSIEKGRALAPQLGAKLALAVADDLKALAASDAQLVQEKKALTAAA
jgi:hypothetical protein